MNRDLILIGMPGCGKSTLGRRLAKKLSMEFLDLDAEIEALAQTTIADLFATQGETGFREWETRAFRQAVGKGRVIATGGGIVTQAGNLPIAKRGMVIMIDRPLEQIMEDVDTESRPLLKEGKLRLLRLYEERDDLYHSWADVVIPNDDELETVLERIIKEVEKNETHGH